MVMNNLLLFIAFAISTIADLLIIGAIFFLFYKLFRTKIVTLENNREIYEHDKMFADLQEQVDNIKGVNEVSSFNLPTTPPDKKNG